MWMTSRAAELVKSCNPGMENLRNIETENLEKMLDFVDVYTSALYICLRKAKRTIFFPQTLFIWY